MRYTALLLFFIVNTAAFSSEDTILVTASRLPSPSAAISESFTVINREEIRSRGAKTVDELLATAPSVVVQRNGGPGQTSSVLIRGAKSEYTLVLIDGMIVNDALTPGRSFDFSQLSTDNIERIEVIRGPQSVLYGSDAIGGVIQIITKKGAEKTTASLSAEYGSYHTQSYTRSLRATIFRTLGYSMESSWEKSQGFSAASEQYGNTERDGYVRFTVAPSLTLPLKDKGSLQWTTRYIQAKVDTDAFGGIGGDKIGTAARTKQLHTRLQHQYFLSDKWESISSIGLSQNHRTDNTTGDSFFRGSRKKIDWQNNYYANDIHTLTAGIEATQETGRATDLPQEKNVEIYGFFLQEKFAKADWFGTVGVRLDKQSIYGYSPTYRLAPGYYFSPLHTKFKATYGTGFKAPSLYQLYSQYGSTALRPEKARSYEVGAEHFLSSAASVEFVHFNNQFKEMIDFDTVNKKYKNISRTETYGFETIAKAHPLERIDQSLTYTWLRALDRSTNAYLVRRPRDSWSADTKIKFGVSTLNFSQLFVGKRNDAGRQLSPYYLLNVHGNYYFSKYWKLSARLENAFDRKYEEIAGYGTARRSFYAGVEASL